MCLSYAPLYWNITILELTKQGPQQLSQGWAKATRKRRKRFSLTALVVLTPLSLLFWPFRLSCCCCCLIISDISDSLQPHGLQPTRLLRPWDSPGQNTGVGCHFLLQGIFPTQGSHPGLLHGRWILYHWATREAPSLLILSQFLRISIYAQIQK